MTNSACCIRSVEKWYKSFLAVSGGNHSEQLTQYFLESNGDLAPFFGSLLGSGIEFRVAAAKNIGQARMQPLVCLTCGTHIALVILSLPFMLLIFRLQSIFISLIESWTITPLGPDKFKETVKCKEVGSAQVRQLSLALEMYLGDKNVTHEGIPELLRGIDSGSKEAKACFLDALRVAESWVVAHEVFHVILASDADGPFPLYAVIAESHKEPRDTAARYCVQVAEAYHLDPPTAELWREEFQADLMACRFLLIAIADRRYTRGGKFLFKAEDVRNNSARAVVNGVAAALEAIFWVDVQAGVLATKESERAASHPPHHERWKLVEAYMKAIVNVAGNSFLNNIDVMAGLSYELKAAYENHDAVISPVDR